MFAECVPCLAAICRLHDQPSQTPETRTIKSQAVDLQEARDRDAPHEGARIPLAIHEIGIIKKELRELSCHPIALTEQLPSVRRSLDGLRIREAREDVRGELKKSEIHDEFP